MSMPVPGATPSPESSRQGLVELARLDARLLLDIRYAGPHNFTGRPIYPLACAWLQHEAAAALVRAHDRLQRLGHSLIVLDAYRPWRVTRDFWAAYPQFRSFIADPETGSVHNRGCAVDVTLADREGRALAMPSDYDEFGERACPDYAGGDAAARANRDRLRAAMEAEGFAVHPREWWHFDHQCWARYPVLDVGLADLAREP